MAMLSNRRSKCIGVKDHPLGKDPTMIQIEPTRLEMMVVRLREGKATTGEVAEIAKGHIRLAINIAGRYAAYCPNKVDDFVSCGMFGILHAIQMASEKMVNNNITPWIVANIHRFIHRFMMTDQTIAVPYSTYKRHKKKGLTLHIPYNVGLDANISRNRRKEQEVLEMIQATAKDKTDQAIIQMRSQGYNDREIGEALEIDRSSVSLRRKAMEQRYNILASA